MNNTNSIVQAAIDNYKNREISIKLEEQSTKDKVKNALQLRDNYNILNLEKNFSKLKDGINEEFDAYRTLQNPFGEETFNKAKARVSDGLDNISKFKSEAEAYRKYLGDETTNALLTNIDSLKKINDSCREHLEKNKDLYTSFDNQYDYYAYVLNNTATYENGMSSDMITARNKAYNTLVARFGELERLLKVRDEAKKVDTGRPLLDAIANFTADVATEEDIAISKEMRKLNEQIVLYERFNKGNDAVFWENYNDEKFLENCKYIPRESKNSDAVFYPDEYRTFLEYYNIGPDLRVHIPLVQSGKELIDYYNTAQSKGWNYATKSEFDMLNYIANTKGDGEAQEYFENLSKELTYRRSAEKEAQWNEKYNQSSMLSKIGLNIASVPQKLFGNLSSGMLLLEDILVGNEYDPYAAYHDLRKKGDNTRYNTEIEIEKLTDEANVLGFTVGDVYQAAMSGVDSLAGAVTFGKGYSAIMAVGAASTKAEELYKQGATNEQIAIASFSAGVSEMLFETISIDYFLKNVLNAPTKTLKQWFVKSLASGGVEMSEETLTKISNIYTDAIVLGSQSEWSQTIDKYKQKGYSDSDAIINALWDIGGNVLKEGFSGFISGGFIGGGGSAINYASNKIADKYNAVLTYGTSPDSINALVNNGLGMPVGSNAYKLATKASAQIKSGKNLSGTTLYNLANAIQGEIESKSSERLSELGIDNKTTKALSPIVAKAVFGENLTQQEQVTLNINEVAAQVVKELSADRANTVWKNAIKNNSVNFSIPSNKNTILHSESNDNIINNVGDDYVDEKVNAKDIEKISQVDVLSNVSGESHRIDNESYANNALNELELTAILNYKSSASYIINDVLRNSENLSDVKAEFVRNMDDALIKMPTYQGTVYRNIAFDWFGGQEAYDAFLSEHKVGYVVNYLAFTSASIKEDGYLVDGRFAVSMVIESGNAKNVDGYGNNFESEVIFPRNSVFVVNNVKYNDNGQPIIYMTEVIKNDEGKHGQFYSKERSEVVQSLSKSQPRYSDLQDISEDNTTRCYDRKNYLQSVSEEERGLKEFDYEEIEKLKENFEDRVESRLLELGIDNKTAKALSPIVAKAVFGEKLSLAEHSMLNNSEIATQVVKELSADRINTVWKDAIKNSSINNLTENNAVTEQGDVLQSNADSVVDGDIAATQHNENSKLQSNKKNNIINSVGDNFVNKEADNESVREIREKYFRKIGDDFQGGISETAETFSERTRRNSLEGSGQERLLLNEGKLIVAYTPVKDDNSQKHIFFKKLREYGIDIYYCDGVIETNVDGVTMVHNQAITTRGGKIFVSSVETVEFKSMMDHELVHWKMRMFSDSYFEYEDIVLRNLNRESNYYIAFCEELNLREYNNRYDINTIEGAIALNSEITAYVYQYVLNNSNFAENFFSKMFFDWHNVKNAVKHFNSKMEINTELFNQVGSYDESAFFAYKNKIENNTTEQGEVLQSTADGVVDSVNDFNYNDNSIKEGENYNGEDTKLLERGTVSATDRGDNILRESGTNSETLAACLEVSYRSDEPHIRTIWAGECGWLAERATTTGKKTRESFKESIHRRIRGIRLSGKDTIGGIVSPKILEKFKNTICKDENGNLISLYHWASEIFETFSKGEFGFHFGTLQAANERHLQFKEENPGISQGVYKEVILNITNPIEISDEAGEWNASWVALQLLEIGIISEQQYNDLSKLSGFNKNTYDNPAAKAVREILAQNGYDGIIYENLSEDAGSYSLIALYPEQIITIAENGVLKENSGVSRAISNEEIASFDSGEKQTNGIDADEFIKGLRGEDDSDSEVLQSSATGVVDSVNDFNYNDNSIKEGENYNGEDTKLLERGTVSATDRGDNILRESGTNSETLAACLEVSYRSDEPHIRTIWAGECGWLAERATTTGKKTRESFKESIHRRIRGIRLSGKDTIGGIVSPKILEKFKNTICKDENGNLISLYHWASEIFETFSKGEFGFHFGTLQAANERHLQFKEENPGISQGVYKEVILNITNPIEISDEAGEWNASWVALQLLEIGIISEQQYNDLSKLSGFNKNTYDNPAAKAVREILAQNGYDGIIYENLSEDAGSYSLIALYPEQIITIAENGVLKENSGVSRAISNEEIASFDSGEKQTNGIDADEFIKGLYGEDNEKTYKQNGKVDAPEGVGDVQSEYNELAALGVVEDADGKQYFDDGSGDNITKSNVVDDKVNNIGKKEYDKFFFKKPIKVSQKDWSKVNAARLQKYSHYSEEDIPDVDFFRIAEYNQINIAYKYVVRNYDKYNFEIVFRTKIKPEASQVRLEEKHYDETAYTKDDASFKRSKR